MVDLSSKELSNKQPEIVCYERRISELEGLLKALVSELRITVEEDSIYICDDILELADRLDNNIKDRLL